MWICTHLDESESAIDMNRHHREAVTDQNQGSNVSYVKYRPSPTWPIPDSAKNQHVGMDLIDCSCLTILVT